MNASDGTNTPKQPDDAPQDRWGSVPWQQPQDAAGSAAAGEPPAADPGHHFSGAFGDGAFGAPPQEGPEAQAPASGAEPPSWQSTPPAAAFGDSAPSAPSSDDQPTQALSGFGDQQWVPAAPGAESAHDQPSHETPADDQPTQAFTGFGDQQWGATPDAQSAHETPADDQPTQALTGFGDQQWGATPEARPGAEEQSAFTGDQPWQSPQQPSQEVPPWQDEQAGQTVPPWQTDQQPTTAFEQPAWGAQEAAPAPAPFGAPPAALPGDQSVPFPGAANAPGAPYGQGGSGAPPQFGAGEPPVGDAPKKKKRTGLIIGIAAAVLAIAAAGIITPIVIHNNNVARGDELAADFNSKLDSYNNTWNAENLGALTAVNFSGVVPASEFYGLDDSQWESVQSSCETLATAKTKREELAGASVPELVEDEAATASEAYVAAQERASALGEQRREAEELLTESGTAFDDMQQFCDNVGGYRDALVTMKANEDGVLAESYVVPAGGSIESSDGRITWPCPSDGGCPNLYNSDTRNQYADAFATTYVEYAKSMVTQYTDNCIVSRYAAACEVGATEWQKAADEFQAIVDHLKTTEPTVEVGQPLYPNLSFDNASNAEANARTSVANKMKEIDSSSSSGSGGVIAGHFRTQEGRISELVTSITE